MKKKRSWQLLCCKRSIVSERLVDDSGVDKVSYAERCESINGIYLILYKLCDIIADKIRTGMVFNKYC